MLSSQARLPRRRQPALNRSVHVLGVTLISIALLAGACSKRSDSEAKARAEKRSREIAASDRERAREDESRESGAANSPGQKENEAPPSKDDIVEDCHAFVWLTKVISAKTPSADCPQCPSTGEGSQALKFQGTKVERVSCRENTCEAAVTIRASFNPSKGGTITGGLTGWIPLEQREQYSRGQTPSGEQVYHVKITYRREGQGWRPVDFEFGLTNAQVKIITRPTNEQEPPGVLGVLTVGIH